MKRIIFCLLLIWGISNTTFAEEYVCYENEHFQATFLNSWTTNNYGHSMRTTSPDKSCSILIATYPKGDQYSLDERIALFESAFPSSDKKHDTREETGELFIDDVPARYSLFIRTNSENIKVEYFLFYYLYIGNDYYIIWNLGKYENLEKDRKIISKIISSMRLHR